MADGTAEFARSSIERCLYCHEAGLTPAIVDVEDFFFRNVGGRFDYGTCPRCASLVLTDPLVSEVLHEAYSEYYTHASPRSSSGSGLRGFLRKHYLDRRFGSTRSPVSMFLAAIYQRLATDFDTIDRAGRYAPRAPATILDYGCGDGEFLIRMREFGHSVTGVDFDPVCVRRGLDRGLSVFTPDDVPSEEWRGNFDFISLAHVIEHVPDPGSLLAELRKWLRPGGTLFIETPNANAHGLDIFGRYWRGLEAPRHLSVPSAKGLLEAAEKAGFRLERQIVSQSLRSHLWEECLSAVPEAKQPQFVDRIKSAPPLTYENAEFLTFLLAKDS